MRPTAHPRAIGSTCPTPLEGQGCTPRHHPLQRNGALFHVGPFAITGYTILLDIGLLCGAMLSYLKARRGGFSVTQAADAILAVALGGLLGGRAVYVTIHWPYYDDYLRRALRIWDGGLAWQGAVVGGVITLSAHCAARRVPLGRMLDALTPGAAVVAVFGWLACLATGCACGVETYPVQRLLWSLSLELPDLYGIREPRVALQLLGAGWSLVVLIAVLVTERGPRCTGLRLPLWLSLYSAGSFALGFLRADEVPLAAGWRVDQLADAALALIAAIVLLTGLLKTRKVEER